MSVLASVLRRLFPAPALSAPATDAAPQRLTLETQWARLVAMVTASHTRLDETRRFHTAAEDQLDAAAYALGELVDDLAAIMTVPAGRNRPVIYQLHQRTANAGPHKVLARRRAAAAA